MVSRRPPAEDSDRSVLPARLRENAELYFEEWGYLNSEVQQQPYNEERGRARYKASQRVWEARQAYLATLTVRPEGARVFDFLLAHGFIYPDRNTAKTKHLTL